MHNQIPANPTLVARFLSLAGIELLIAGLLASGIAILQSFITTAILSSGVAFVGLLLLLAPLHIKRNPAAGSGLLNVLRSRYGQITILTLPAILSVLLWVIKPDITILPIGGILLLGLWLIGLEVLFVFREEKHHPAPAKKDLPLLNAALSLLLAYGILFIPSRVPSLLDGIPWDTPAEFTIATLLLPFSIILGRNFLGKRLVMVFLILLFAIKLLLTFFLPQSGLGVRVYFSEEALHSSKWERGYGSLIIPSYTQVTRLPYQTYREFPIEWINHHGFKKDSLWVALELYGAVSLKEDERLVFLIEGAQKPKIQLMNLDSKDASPATIVRSTGKLNAQLFSDIPPMQEIEMHGVLVFPELGQFRLEPLILYPDGSARSALPEMRLSPAALDFQIAGFQLVLNFISIVLVGIILVSLLDGTRALHRIGTVTSVDIYLAITGLILFYLANVTPKLYINIPILIATSGLVLIKILDLSARPQKYSATGYLLSIGIPILLMFLSIDIDQLQSVTIFESYQDNLEYQWLAHNIYVKGDIFLVQTPPYVYKVLFPYFIGFLHLLFGQSAVAQLFLNVWCALLSSILIAKLSLSFGLPVRSAFLISMAFPLILFLPYSFVFYYRFGLIEPVAILCLLAVYYFANNRRVIAMVITGMITGLFRLNFVGAILAAAILVIPAITGPFKAVWMQFLNWLKAYWKLLVVYLVSIFLPIVLISLGYLLAVPGFKLTHWSNNQESLWSIVGSLFIVLFGGYFTDVRDKLLRHQFDILLLAIPVFLAFLIALVSTVYRKGAWAKVDLRLSLLFLSILPVYTVLKPLGYFPRYTWSPLPLALIIIASLLYYYRGKDESKT